MKKIFIVVRVTPDSDYNVGASQPANIILLTGTREIGMKWLI